MWTSLGDIILPTLKLQVLPILKSRGIRWGIHNSKQGSLGSLLPEGDWLSSVTRSEASDGALSQASLHFCLHHPSTVAPECEGFFHYEPQKPTLADISKRKFPGRLLSPWNRQKAGELYLEKTRTKMVLHSRTCRPWLWDPSKNNLVQKLPLGRMKCQLSLV